MPDHSMIVRTRQAVTEDAAALAEVSAASFPLATPQDTEAAAIADFVRDVLGAHRFVEYVADPARVVLVAEHDERVIGFAMLIEGDPDDPEVVAAITTRPTIDLNKFYVHPDQHGSGAASTLMLAAIDAARATGARAVWLGVNNENARANRFYEKHGFVVVGTKHFRLGDRLEDDYVRELVL